MIWAKPETSDSAAMIWAKPETSDLTAMIWAKSETSDLAAVEPRSRLALPAAVIVHLPIGHFEAVRLRGGPALARGSKRLGVLAVE